MEGISHLLHLQLGWCDFLECGGWTTATPVHKIHISVGCTPPSPHGAVVCATVLPHTSFPPTPHPEPVGQQGRMRAVKRPSFMFLSM